MGGGGQKKLQGVKPFTDISLVMYRTGYGQLAQSTPWLGGGDGAPGVLRRPPRSSSCGWQGGKRSLGTSVNPLSGTAAQLRCWTQHPCKARGRETRRG